MCSPYSSRRPGSAKRHLPKDYLCNVSFNIANFCLYSLQPHNIRQERKSSTMLVTYIEMQPSTINSRNLVSLNNRRKSFIALMLNSRNHALVFFSFSYQSLINFFETLFCLSLNCSVSCL